MDDNQLLNRSIILFFMILAGYQMVSAGPPVFSTGYHKLSCDIINNRQVSAIYRVILLIIAKYQRIYFDEPPHRCERIPGGVIERSSDMPLSKVDL